MQSAFVDIGLDGDAFLYVSDVFENLEDYDHGHSHEQPQTTVASLPPANASPVELLPGNPWPEPANTTKKHTTKSSTRTKLIIR